MTDETSDRGEKQPGEGTGLYEFRPSQSIHAKEPPLLSPARMTPLAVEMIFLLLGILVVWLGATGHINFDRRSMGWLVISIGVVAWGLLALGTPGQWWARLQTWNRGGSMLLLGLLMLAISRVPFLWVGRLLAICGVVLIVRGALGSVLLLKQR